MFVNCLQMVKKEKGLLYRKLSSLLCRGDHAGRDDPHALRDALVPKNRFRYGGIRFFEDPRHARRGGTNYDVIVIKESSGTSSFVY